MVNNYIVLLLIAYLFRPGVSNAQEIRIFTVEDFDLKGAVRSCLVSTKYGKEEYEFNEEGLLTKSVTRYNDNDYDSTHYSYVEGMLMEKRLENYRDKIFVPASSIANIYSVDSTENLKITEKIISYDKEFLDQYEYFYTNDTLRRIIRMNNEGIDETLISYELVKGELTKTYTLNGVPEKSIRTSFKKDQDSIISKTVLVKQFLDGQPYLATEEVFDGRNALASKTSFSYNTKVKQFTIERTEKYEYDASGMLLNIESETSGIPEKKEFVYQLDPTGNWIKEIITPDNTYKTRRITYHEAAVEEQKK